MEMIDCDVLETRETKKDFSYKIIFETKENIEVIRDLVDMRFPKTVVIKNLNFIKE